MVAGRFNARNGITQVARRRVATLETSAPHVALVVFDTVLFQELSVLVLKSARPMVLALVRDILDDLGQLRPAHRECPVAVLPTEMSQVRKCVMNPFARPALEQLQGLADCKSRRDADDKVNMIFDAADLQGLHVIPAGDAAKIFPDALFDILANPAFAVFGAENQVVVQARVGVGHGDVSGFKPIRALNAFLVGKKRRRSDATRFKTSHRRNRLSEHFIPLESSFVAFSFPRRGAEYRGFRWHRQFHVSEARSDTTETRGHRLQFGEPTYLQRRLLSRPLMKDANRTGPYQPPTVDEVAADQPRSIGRYRIEKVLGKGGFDIFYQAHDEKLRRRPWLGFVRETQGNGAYPAVLVFQSGD
jgi:hypothetical protein